MIPDRDFTNQLNSSYKNFREQSLRDRRFKHSDIKPLIENLRNNKLFSVKQIGVSVQHREIYLISIGTGKAKIFLWSQMHGNEPTATMALFDIFNFFAHDNQFEDFKKEILKKLTIYFIPMVNPDGAEVFERRNLYQVDINRDAARLITPEGKILKDTFYTLNADFGFNLHDQSIYYSAGKSFKSAAISFLAPAINSEMTINPVRYKAMQLIGQLKKLLEDYIPGHIGRYSEDFEPRAFGDTFQRWGTSIILIETGGWKDDSEKQFLRKLNFIILFTSFKSIAEKGYEKEKLDNYNNIPLNEEDNIMDLVLRNLKYQDSDKNIIIDIGINRTEMNTNTARDFYSIGRIADIGDLSTNSGYEDYDFGGMEIAKGKTFQKRLSSVEELNNLNFPELYSQGCTNVIIDFTVEKKYTEFPINLIFSEEQNDPMIKVDEPANFYITKYGRVKYVIINGSLIEIDNPHPENINGEVIR
jgi:hypothetical protein